MTNLANDVACPCNFCTPRPDVASEPGEALEDLRRRWAAERVEVAQSPTDTLRGAPRPHPEALRGISANDTDGIPRRHWRRWLRVPHLHHPADHDEPDLFVEDA